MTYLASLSRMTRGRWLIVLALLAGLASSQAWAHGATGPQGYLVARVEFSDSTTPPRYSRADVEGFAERIRELFVQNANDKVDLRFIVTDVYKLPGSAASYSSAGLMAAVNDAINPKVAPPAVLALRSNSLHGVIVVLSNKFDWAASLYATVNVGTNGAPLFVGLAVVGENPGDSDRAVWGRWAHEVGHTLQMGGGPAHPSAYGSDFELMDRNYPGRIGAVSLQYHVQHPHWLPPPKYQTFTPAGGGGHAALWTYEQHPAGQPNVQALKVEISPKQYYMVSVRRRLRGDELTAATQFNPPGQQGIPDEGVLIERVDEVTSAHNWVKVIGRNAAANCVQDTPSCNGRQLWQAGDRFVSPNEVTIEVLSRPDDDHFLLRVIYDDIKPRPDVMLMPWLSPPGNTWETTDIWVDNPVNGFGVIRYGLHADGHGGLVPVGNGDNPALGFVNRVYARIRNVGNAAASNVRVTIEVTDPLGLGITPGVQWLALGTVDSATFPQLASVASGAYVDVYVEWTPIAPAGAAAGGATIDLHSCLRVRIDPVPGETVLANQDGEREQENIAYFDRVAGVTKKTLRQKLLLSNAGSPEERHYTLTWRLQGTRGPGDGWHVQFSEPTDRIRLAPGETRWLGVELTPGGPSTRLGERVDLELITYEHVELLNRSDPRDRHNEFRRVAGATLGLWTVAQTPMSCRIARSGPDAVVVEGRVRLGNGANGAVVALAPATRDGRYVNGVPRLAKVRPDGRFSARLDLHARQRRAMGSVDCLFAGSTQQASARVRAALR